MSIANLPTELLCEIAACIVQNDTTHVALSQLAQTCRRLQDVLNPQILSHHHHQLLTTRFLHWGRAPRTEPSSAVGSRVHENPLLCQSQYVNVDIYLMADIPDVDGGLRSIRSFIFCSPTIKAISIYHDGRFNIRMLPPLLNACAQRPDLALCVNATSETEGGPFDFRFLQVNRDSSSWSITPVVEPSSFTRITEYLRTTVNSLISCSQKPSKDKTLEEMGFLTPVPSPLPYAVVARQPLFQVSLPRSKPQIGSLSIAGDTLFSASYYPWTLHIINSSPLISLSITLVTLTLFNWTEILPSLTIPTLENLSIGKAHIAFPDLLAFLQRHTSLTTLDLSENDVIGTVRLPVSVSTRPDSLLPLLHSLTATSEYTLPFLQYQQQGYFPKLRNFVVQAPHNSHNELSPIYDCIATGRYANVSLTLDSISSSHVIHRMVDLEAEEVNPDFFSSALWGTDADIQERG